MGKRNNKKLTGSSSAKIQAGPKEKQIKQKDDRINNNKPETASHISNIKESEKSHKYTGINSNQVFPISSGARPKHGWNGISDPAVKEYHVFDEFNHSSESGYSESECSIHISYDESGGRIKSQQKLNQKGIETKENLISSVNEYERSKDSFLNIYHKWLPERKNTLKELQFLYDQVHDGRMKYNEGQAEMKEFNSFFRHTKLKADNKLTSFFASAMSLALDAASGASSFTQAYNTESFQNKFQDIMNHDAEITKELYEIRSRCVTKYHGIEEVMVKFHSDTFSSTMSKISDALEVDKYWETMKTAYEKDNMPKLVEALGEFFDNACRSDVLEKVGNSVGTYVNDNPAVLEGCKSSSKALYDAANTWEPINSRSGLKGRIETAANVYLMIEDKNEAERLKNEYCNQSKLESQIEDAMNILKSEMEEVYDNYSNLFKY